MDNKYKENQEEREKHLKGLHRSNYCNSRNDEEDNQALEDKKLYLVVPGNNPEIVKTALSYYQNFKDSYLDENDDYSLLSFIWKPTQFTLKQQFKIDYINYNREYPLIVNHIESFRTILTKNGLYRALKNYYSNHTLALLHQYNENESVPTTFVIEPEFSEEEFSTFTKRFKEISLGNYQNEPVPSKHCTMNMWLVKPANQNQGRGIDSFKKFKEIKDKIYGNEQKTCWIIQKYIEKPLLYDGRKFDIRVWALLMDSANLFIYKEGYIRTSSEKYSVQSSQNFVHLTNNCLQIHNPNYGNFEEGNTLSFDTFKSYLQTNYQEKNIIFEEHIFARIRDLIIDSILSVRSEISIGKKKYSFEFIGYDFLIDEDFRVWLIEANVNPYIGVANNYIKGLLDKMLKDLFEIIFFKSYSSYAINANNNFQLVYCEKGSIFSPSAFNLRSAFSKKNLYPPSLGISFMNLEGKAKKKLNNSSFHFPNAKYSINFEKSVDSLITSDITEIQQNSSSSSNYIYNYNYNYNQNNLIKIKIKIKKLEDNKSQNMILPSIKSKNPLLDEYIESQNDDAKLDNFIDKLILFIQSNNISSMMHQKNLNMVIYK